MLRLLLAELPTKTAVKLAAEITGASRNTLYDRALEIKREARRRLSLRLPGLCFTLD